MNLVESIRKCVFDSGKGKLKVWKGTNWLWEGQHRAAALLWNYNKDYLVEVKEEGSPPTDHYQCSNPCS